ncbi:phospho-sugar mutase [Shewanella corallii]|uniref:Phospho-sugar mutase n=1 Tax=Shewanella corallii TaxID=560080 RepID=A0ABT0N442_9GAMM|nr:phospho-sugar mutase [Shewanella corallii]MCL2913214.1 phospho-sugar mutase [Shewanella corallii]
MNTHLHFQVSRWLELDPDAHTKAEIQSLLDAGNESELAERFSGRLEFGTAGLRGVVGAGPSRMNRLVVQQTSAGLGQYLLRQVKDAKVRGVVIGYDGRNDSRQFAHDAAAILTALGIKVRLTFKVAATPLVAFGVKHFNAAAGIVVTASHNPPEYNGYKVYWENGAQIIPPHDAGIAACIEAAANTELKLADLSEATKAGTLVWLQDDYYQTYRRAVEASPELAPHGKANVSLSYTAMHGVGAEMAETLLRDAGFDNVYSVAAQRLPDGNFPTVAFPNPEEKGAMDLVIAEAVKHDALLACANDPDADRFAVAVQAGPGHYQMLTGDQVGVLLGHYLLSHAPANQKLVGNTIVSSSLLAKVASTLGGTPYTTLTGFKWLMNVGQTLQSDDAAFLFAYEEALGYTVGSTVWDKDGLTAQLAFVQMVAELNAAGLTVWDRLESIYREHGFHLNDQVSIKLRPETPNIGAFLRQNPPSHIGDAAVTLIEDIKHSKRSFADGRVEAIDLPASDVLTYWLDNGSRVIVRPSGTEPKIKCYYEVVTAMDDSESLKEAQVRARELMDNFISAHQASLPQ